MNQPSLVERIRTSLAPRLEPELHRSRARIARTVLITLIGLLAVWSITLVLTIPLRGDQDYSYAFDVFAIVGSAAAGALAWRSLQQGNLLRTGYLLSIASFTIVAIGAFTFPDFFYLVSAGFMIPILISGAIIGGTSSSLFAGLSIAFNATALVLALPDSAIAIEPIGNIIFLFTHSIAAIAAAVVLQNLSLQVNRTVNSLHRQADQMAKLAHTDPLTGLANRRFLFEQLESEFARARRYNRPFSLLYIDLDGFKAVNDQFGHLFGDEILRGSAIAMQAVLRSTDLLARIGGDEFAVLMPETRLQGSLNAASKLRKALAAYSRQLSSTIPTLTFSVGISEITREDEEIEDILSRADRAQYLAKTTGKSMTRTQKDLQESLSADSS